MRFQDLNGILKQGLRRRAVRFGLESGTGCPGEVKLSDFYAGLLAPEENEKIRRHLGECPYCLEQIEQVGRWRQGGEQEQMTGPSAGARRRAEELANPKTKPELSPEGKRESPENPGGVSPAGEISFSCRKCGGANPPQSVFCRLCGSRLAVPLCPGCGRAAERGNRYCCHCGRELVAGGKIILPRTGKTGRATLADWLKAKKWLLGSAAALLVSFFWSRYFLQFLIVSCLLAIKWIFDAGASRTLIMIYDTWRRHDRNQDEDDRLSRRIKERNKMDVH